MRIITVEKEDKAESNLPPFETALIERNGQSYLAILHPIVETNAGDPQMRNVTTGDNPGERLSSYRFGFASGERAVVEINGKDQFCQDDNGNPLFFNACVYSKPKAEVAASGTTDPSSGE